MQRVLLFTALLALALCEQMVPIPREEYGFHVGDKNGKFHIQAFIDLQCTPITM